MIDITNAMWSTMSKDQFDAALWMELSFGEPAYDEDDAADNQHRTMRDLYQMSDEDFESKLADGSFEEMI